MRKHLLLALFTLLSSAPAIAAMGEAPGPPHPDARWEGWRQAHALAVQIPDQDQRNACLLDIVERLVAGQGFTGAAELCDAIDDWRRPVALLAVAAARPGRETSALLERARTLVEAREDGWRPRLQSRLAEALARHGELAAAEKITREVSDEEEAAYARRALAIAYVDRGDFAAAEAVIATMTENLRYRAHVAKARALAALAQGLRAAGDTAGGVAALARAEELARRTRGWMDSASFTAVASAAFHVGAPDIQAHLMQDAEALVQEVQGPWRAAELARLAYAWHEQQNPAEAERLFEEAEAALAPLHAIDRSEQTARVAAWLVRADRGQRARALAGAQIIAVGEWPAELRAPHAPAIARMLALWESEPAPAEVSAVFGAE
jgi:tetratricopeptide (TPR) repeat protein